MPGAATTDPNGLDARDRVHFHGQPCGEGLFLHSITGILNTMNAQRLVVLAANAWAARYDCPSLLYERLTSSIAGLALSICSAVTPTVGRGWCSNTPWSRAFLT